MKFEILQVREFPHARTRVWKALTDATALGKWLMETDVEAQEGRTFNMWCENPAGETDHYLCQVLEIEPQRRMLWSWSLEGSSDKTLVEFRLEDTAYGTRLTVRHEGDLDEGRIEAFRSGWPGKLEQLAGVCKTEPQ